MTAALRIDFHTHVDVAEHLGLVDPPERVVADLDRVGFDLAVCMAYVDAPAFGADPVADLADRIAPYAGRLLGFARLHPAHGRRARSALRRAVGELGLRGLKLHPTSTLAHPADPPTVALLREAGRLGVPVLFHSGDDLYSTPQVIAAAAARAPDTAVVLGHMGGYLHVEAAVEAAEALPNVYLETSVMPYPAAVADAVARVGAERVLYGSDGPRANPAVELEKVHLAGLDPAAERLVLGGAATALLGLEGP